MKWVFVICVALLALGCEDIPSPYDEVPVVGDTGDTLTVVERMLTVDGITVYRFLDHDTRHYVYFANSGAVQYSTTIPTGKTSYTHTTQVYTVRGGRR